MTDPEQTPALKPCPFCGKPPAVTRDDDGEVMVSCSKDDWRDCPPHVWVTPEVWNRRAPSETPEGRPASPSVSEREALGKLIALHTNLDWGAHDMRDGPSHDDRPTEGITCEGCAKVADAILATYTIQRKPT